MATRTSTSSRRLAGLPSEEQGQLLTGHDFYAPGTEPWKDKAITTEVELESFFWYLSAFDEIALDFETRTTMARTVAYDPETDGTKEVSITYPGTDPYHAEIIGVSLCAGGKSRYLPVKAHPHDPTLPWDAVRAVLADLAAMDKLWGAHNGVAFDWIVWKREGLPWPIRFYDTLVMAWLADPQAKKGQKVLEEDILGIKRPLFKDVAGKEGDLTKASLAHVADYAQRDAAGVERLKPILEASLRAKGLEAHYPRSRDQIEIAMWVEDRGMPVDPAYMWSQRKACDAYLAEQVAVAEQQAQQLANDAGIRCSWGPPENATEDLLGPETWWDNPPPQAKRKKRSDDPNEINLRSHDQMLEFLFRRCGLKSDYGKGIKEGISKSMLIRLSRDGVVLADTLKNLSKVGKMLSGFYEPITENMRYDDKSGCWRLYTRFNPWRTKTGRWSSSDPVNLQNQPNFNSAYPWTAIRKGFRASPGYKLICGDLSQIELVILTHFSRDPTMTRIFTEEGGDIHAMTGSRIAGVDYEEFRTWDPKKLPKGAPLGENQHRFTRYRLQAKPLNFGISYLMGPAKFQLYAADNYDVWWTLKEARTAIATWFGLYERVPWYHQEVLKRIVACGEVPTIFGRKSYFSQELAAIVMSNNRDDSRYWDGHSQWRKAVNVPVQGSAFDLIGAAQRAVYDRWYGTDVHHISQVHDEIILEAPEEKADRVAAELKEIMESFQVLRLKYKSSCAVGDTWAAAH